MASSTPEADDTQPGADRDLTALRLSRETY